jgi:hypothetical protein
VYLCTAQEDQGPNGARLTSREPWFTSATSMPNQVADDRASGWRAPYVPTSRYRLLTRPWYWETKRAVWRKHSEVFALTGRLLLPLSRRHALLKPPKEA